MTDQPHEMPAPRPDETGSEPVIGAVPPTAPDSPLTSSPAAGGDWTAAPRPPSWQPEGPAVSTAVVAPVVVARRPRVGLRWAIAALVVVLVAATASAAFFVLAGSGSASTVAKWAPADAMVYMEARFDLPGDQHDRAARFLSAFPGFADPSTLDTKLAEVYDRIIGDASKDKADYSTDIKPWFGGQVAIELSALPSSTGSNALSEVRAALLLSVTDAAKANGWLATLPDMAKGTKATYQGIDLTVHDSGGSSWAVGVDGPVLLVGDLQTVHAIIDAKGANGLAEQADFRKALAAAAGDHVGFMYLAEKRFIEAEMAMMPSGSPPQLDKSFMDMMPAWVGFSARFEADSLVFDGFAPATGLTSNGHDRVSAIAPHLPATTVFAYEAHDLGTAIGKVVDIYKGVPSYKEGLTTVLDALDRVGGLDSFTSWLGDTAVVVTADGKDYGGGVVVTLADQKAADTASGKFASIKNLVALAGLKNAKVTTATHGAATITTIDFGSVSDLKALGGSSFGGSGLGSGMPAAVADARLAISYTISDGLLIVGVGGDGFVSAVLDTRAGSSLVDQPRYKAAADRAGASNTAQLFVDIQAIRTAIEAALPADARADYDKNTKPYLAPFDALMFVVHAGDPTHDPFVVTVGK